MEISHETIKHKEIINSFIIFIKLFSCDLSQGHVVSLDYQQQETKQKAELLLSSNGDQQNLDLTLNGLS